MSWRRRRLCLTHWSAVSLKPSASSSISIAPRVIPVAPSLVLCRPRQLSAARLAMSLLLIPSSPLRTMTPTGTRLYLKPEPSRLHHLLLIGRPQVEILWRTKSSVASVMLFMDLPMWTRNEHVGTRSVRPKKVSFRYALGGDVLDVSRTDGGTSWSKPWRFPKRTCRTLALEFSKTSNASRRTKKPICGGTWYAWRRPVSPL